MSETVVVAVVAAIAAFLGSGLSTIVGWINSQNTIDSGTESLERSEQGLNERLETKISADLEKLSSKLDKQYELRWRTDWQRQLHESLSEFIVETDPDLLNENTDRKKIVGLIHKTTILLNNNEIELHGKLNHEIIQMGLYTQGYRTGAYDQYTALRYHESLIEAAKKVLYLPSD